MVEIYVGAYYVLGRGGKYISTSNPHNAEREVLFSYPILWMRKFWPWSTLRFKPGSISKDLACLHILKSFLTQIKHTSKSTNHPQTTWHTASSKPESSFLEQRWNLQGEGLKFTMCQLCDSEQWPSVAHLLKRNNNTPSQEWTDKALSTLPNWRSAALG